MDKKGNKAVILTVAGVAIGFALVMWLLSRKSKKIDQLALQNPGNSNIYDNGQYTPPYTPPYVSSGIGGLTKIDAELGINFGLNGGGTVTPPYDGPMDDDISYLEQVTKM